MKLSEIYNNLLDLNEQNNCYYYHRDTKIDDRGVGFIRKYLKDGGKLKLINNEEAIFNNDYFMMRSEHMRSLFLLGIYCYDNINVYKLAVNGYVRKLYHKTCEENQHNILTQGESLATIHPLYNQEEITEEFLRKDFLYLWYLICLYHDIGYVYEKGALAAENIYPNEVFGCMESVPGIPNIFLRSIDKYYHLKKSTPLLLNNPCIDHGIYGGMCFYRTLEHLHSSAVIQSIEHEDNDGLLWGRPIFNNYLVPAAFCIICHNMFTVFSGTQNAWKYSMLGLQELIRPYEASIISPNLHPLLFLLCMLDTIEPVKFFVGDRIVSTQQVDEILDNCTIYTSDTELSISWNSKKIGFSSCRSICQYKKDTGNCAKYSCMRKLADNLVFLLSDACHVSVDSTWLKISLNALPAMAR